MNGRMSAFGPKRTSLVAPHMSAFGGKADLTFCGPFQYRFEPLRSPRNRGNRTAQVEFDR